MFDKGVCGVELPIWNKKKKSPAAVSDPERETAAGLEDVDASPAAYAVDDEYEAEETK